MIPLVIDSNIFFSALYNPKGLERKILNFIIEKEEIQLFAPDIFWEEIKRNLVTKLGYLNDEVNEIVLKFNILKVPQEKYENFIQKAETLIKHKEDFPFIAVSLFLNCPLWSGNVRHFKYLEDSKDIIWFNSRSLFAYLKEKGLI